MSIEKRENDTNRINLSELRDKDLLTRVIKVNDIENEFYKEDEMRGVRLINAQQSEEKVLLQEVLTPSQQEIYNNKTNNKKSDNDNFDAMSTDRLKPTERSPPTRSSSLKRALKETSPSTSMEIEKKPREPKDSKLSHGQEIFQRMAKRVNLQVKQRKKRKTITQPLTETISEHLPVATEPQHDTISPLAPIVSPQQSDLRLFIEKHIDFLKKSFQCVSLDLIGYFSRLEKLETLNTLVTTHHPIFIAIRVEQTMFGVYVNNEIDDQRERRGWLNEHTHAIVSLKNQYNINPFLFAFKNPKTHFRSCDDSFLEIENYFSLRYDNRIFLYENEINDNLVLPPTILTPHYAPASFFSDAKYSLMTAKRHIDEVAIYKVVKTLGGV
ncbi:hypothetical protein EIN_074300 [Entamoeba invadens IP1]|uniref:Uncharacterized protein n=1 Tax=Entamoeba invadens IP1 TaxID=370355 RepID=A0A0A1UBQ4_ENTIV|nr:hypothetical protein EIN_074300 [Entamoeba invadens IP1]ELP92587.1 hypothetical protein EIN_074300 [Entamoeba invadens IP1]|eukprot:XP_004259358.1 hypothetical protein EIN_074300 [Entamoeba invadens IP1]